MAKCIKMKDGKITGFTIDNKIDIDFSSPTNSSYLVATGILDVISNPIASTNEISNLLYKYKLIDYNPDYESSFIGLPEENKYGSKYNIISQSLNFRSYINSISQPLSFSTIELGAESTNIINQLPRGTSLTVDATAFSDYIANLMDNLSPDLISDATPEFLYNKLIQDSISMQDLRYFLNSVSKMISGDMVMEFTNMSEEAYEFLILHVNDYLNTYNNKEILPFLPSFPKFRNRIDLFLEMNISRDPDTGDVELYSGYQKSNEANTFSLTDSGNVVEFRGSIRNKLISKHLDSTNEGLEQSITFNYEGIESSYYEEYRDSHPDFFKDISSINNILSKKPHAILLSDINGNQDNNYTGSIMAYYTKFYSSVLGFSWDHETGAGIIFNKKEYENRLRNKTWEYRVSRKGLPATGYPKYISVTEDGVNKTISIGKVIGGDMVVLNNELVESVKDYQGKGIHPLLYIVLSGGIFMHDESLSQENVDYVMNILNEVEDVNFMLDKLTGQESDHHNVFSYKKNDGSSVIGMEFLKVINDNPVVITNEELKVYKNDSEFFFNRFKENGELMDKIINKIHTYNSQNNSNFIVINENELMNKVAYLSKIPDWESIINDEDFIKSLIC